MKLEISSEKLKSMNGKLAIITGLIIVQSLLVFVGMLTLKRVLYDKDRVIGVTHDIDHNLPAVYSLRDLSMRNEIVKVYEFVENIIHLSEDEVVTNYFSSGRTNRNLISLSASLRKASYLSVGKASELFMDKYYKSSETERRLRAENLAWEMLIDCIDVQPWSIGQWRVDVYGEVQVTKTNQSFSIPHESWDYVKVTMNIISGPVWTLDDGEVVNPWGLYVTDYTKRTNLPHNVVSSAVKGCRFKNDREITRGNL